MATEPNGSNGVLRNARGQYAPGTSGGPGCKYAKRVAMFRKSIIHAVTAKDIRELIQSLLAAAKSGDVAAAKVVLSYTVGNPVEYVSVEAMVQDMNAEATKRPADGAIWAKVRAELGDAATNAALIALARFRSLSREDGHEED